MLWMQLKLKSVPCQLVHDGPPKHMHIMFLKIIQTIVCEKKIEENIEDFKDDFYFTYSNA